MILRFFKSNQPYVLLFLPLVALLFWSYAFVTSPIASAHYGGPLFEMLLNLLDNILWLPAFLSLVAVLVSAIILNGMYNVHEFTDRGNYLPALMFVLFNCFYIALIGLSPIQIGNLFFLLALRRLLTMYHQNSVASEVFDAGALLAIAALFFPPFLICIPFIWTALVILRPFVWREWVLPFLGILTPFVFIFTWYFWFDKTFEWDKFFQLGSFSFPEDMAGHIVLKWIFLAIIIYISLMGLILYFSKMSVSTMNRKNKKQTFLMASLFLLLTFLYASFLPGPSRTEIALLSIPLSVFTSVYFYSSKRKLIATLLFYLWIIILVLNFYWLWLF